MALLLRANQETAGGPFKPWTSGERLEFHGRHEEGGKSVDVVHGFEAALAKSVEPATDRGIRIATDSDGLALDVDILLKEKKKVLHPRSH